MSISKVRVYELARELDLDTKDILAICEQSNIAVKSHSSTITESEADMIRAAAHKNPDKLPKTSPSMIANTSANTNSKTKESATKEVSENRVSKQQILVVSKPTAQLIAPPVADHSIDSVALAENVEIAAETSPEIPKPVELVPPTIITAKNTAINPTPPQAISPITQIAQPPSRVDSKSKEGSAKVIQNSQPVSQEVIKPVPPASRNPNQASSNIISKPTPPREVLKQPKPQIISEPTPPKEVKQEATLEPKTVEKLTEKPVNKLTVKPRVERPNSAKVSDKAPDRVLDQAPDRSNQDKPKVVGRPGANPPSDNARRNLPARPLPVKDSVLIERGITAPTDPPHQMRAPIAPIRPVDRQLDRSPERPSERGLIDKPERVSLNPPNLRKPGDVAAATPSSPDRNAPSRPGKRGKSKKEEDELDLLEQKEKASKLNKPKRYLKVFDDEDVIDDLETDESATNISLSLARPPARPKQRTTKPPTTADNKPGISRGRRSSSRDRVRAQDIEPEKPTTLVLQDSITVQELARKLVLPETDIIRALFLKGMMVNINQTLDIPTASMVATELGYEVEKAEVDAPARKVTEMIDIGDLENKRRPPVVTIMGHVDHGKTTLLDSIRKSKVAQGEAGGITQHIGAYHVEVGKGAQRQQIVFLDTPGHEAFTAMRARGARVTDIAILVVAADDGVQPQTIEAISHAKAAKVPIIVAINKVDKIEAQPDRIRQELTEYGLVDEEWGGETIMVPVSAMKGENLDTLLEMILLVAEVEDLKANPDRAAKGTVIEAHLDKARGPVATFLVQNGTLRVGDILVAGSSFGKVRAMVDDHGVRVDAASPSFAVEVLGLSDVPAAGDEFEVFTDEKLARSTASDRAMAQRDNRLLSAMSSRRITLGTVSAKAQEGELKELNLILKADVQGSVEAIIGALAQLPQQEVQVRVLLSAAGEITENDVDLAAASDAVVIGFNTTMAPGARQASDELGVDVRDYNIIYKLLEDIQDAMEGLLEPELVEEPLGQAEVRALFSIGRGVVAGCYVLSGKLVRNCRVRIKRRNDIVYEAGLDSLKRVKDDAKEVAAGFECGVSLPKYQEWQEGDIIEAFRMATKRRTLSV